MARPITRTTTIALGALLLSAAVGACASRTPAPATPPASDTSEGPPAPMIRMVPGQRLVFSDTTAGMARRPGDIPIERMAEVGPRIAALRAAPAELQLRPGDSLDLREHVRVVALDSGGRPLGTLPVFDRGVRPADGAARFSVPHRIVGVLEGEATLTLTLARAHWGERTDARPSVVVPVRVSASAPSVAARAYGPGGQLRSMRNDGMGGCELRHASLRPPGELPRVGFGCAQVFASVRNGPEERHWLRAIVLTRATHAGPMDQPMTLFDPAAGRRMMDSVFQTHRDAEARGRRILSGTTSGGLPSSRYELSLDHDTLFVEGRTIVIPATDSALVVMVDRDSTGRSNVATATIRAELPQDYWPKSWRNGDTTFFVQPSRAGMMLRDALRAVPGIELFLP